MPDNVSNLLPVRLRPEPDELFSSWISRLAIAHFSKLHTFSSIVFSNRAIWNRDIDKSVDMTHIAEISARTGINRSAIANTTLRNYEGKLYEFHNPNGNSTWLMPVGVFRRTRNRFGLQMCPNCLLEDAETPYYRRLWRISWYTICPKHNIVLLDKCPDCQNPIIFHRGDMGWRGQAVSISMTKCSICHLDWTSRKVTNLLKPADSNSLILQRKLETVLNSGWNKIQDFGFVHSIPFFNGLKNLLRLLSVSRRSRRFREAVSLRCGVEIVPEAENYHHFDHLPVEFRNRTLQMTHWLLEGWQERFIETAEASGTYSSTLCHSKEAIPFWYWSPINDRLSRKTYQITDKEIYSALHWLETRKNLILPSDLENLIGRNLFEHKSNKFIISIYERMAKHNQSSEKKRLVEVRNKAREIITDPNDYSKTKAKAVSRNFRRENEKKPLGYFKAAKMYKKLIDRYKQKERLKMCHRMETAQHAALVASEFGVSPAIVSKWYKRYKKEGVKGLSDHSRKAENFRHQIVFQKQVNWIRSLHAESLDLPSIQLELLNRHNFSISEGGLYRVLKRLNLILPCSKKNRFFKRNRKQALRNRRFPQKKIFPEQERWILDLHEKGLNNSQIRRELASLYNFSICLNTIREALLRNRLCSPQRHIKNIKSKNS